MSEYQTDEEKVEAIRKWWRENGTAVVAGLVLGLAGLIGWQYWGEHRDTRAEQASDLHIALTDAVRTGRLGEASQITDQLYRDYLSTPYPDLAALTLAGAWVGVGDLAAAEPLLRDLVKNARQEPLRRTAALRLARVLHAQGRNDEAMGALDATAFPAAWTALVEELRGDIHRAGGETEQARAAYDRAIAAAAGNAPDHLYMKHGAVAAALEESRS